MIWCCEKLGWAYDVRWPDETRLTAKRTGTRRLGSMTRRAAPDPIGPPGANATMMER